jgi:hypothetical protein
MIIDRFYDKKNSSTEMRAFGLGGDPQVYIINRVEFGIVMLTPRKEIAFMKVGR